MMVSSFKPLLTIIQPIIYHWVSHMNSIRLSFMVVFMYWSLEVPIWSLRPGWAKKWGWAAGIREESRQVALTKKKRHTFWVQPSPKFQRKSNMNKANAAIPESHSFLVVSALLLWNSMRHFQPTGYKTTYDNLYVHGFQSLGMLITFLFSMLTSAMRWAMRCAG